ncbi:hypothetical protein L218DRAFT_361408 [Marasmius fiardii PR-910]|nr:hypothetical protein L218DRAFT_361408 [Marasmius fiardii PR-910]
MIPLLTFSVEQHFFLPRWLHCQNPPVGEFDLEMHLWEPRVTLISNGSTYSSYQVFSRNHNSRCREATQLAYWRRRNIWRRRIGQQSVCLKVFRAFTRRCRGYIQLNPISINLYVCGLHTRRKPSAPAESAKYLALHGIYWTRSRDSYALFRHGWDGGI